MASTLWSKSLTWRSCTLGLQLNRGINTVALWMATLVNLGMSGYLFPQMEFPFHCWDKHFAATKPYQMVTIHNHAFLASLGFRFHCHKTQCQDEFRIPSGRTQKLKVAKWCWKQRNEHNLMYIYHKQCENMQKIQWKCSNGQIQCFYKGTSGALCWKPKKQGRQEKLKRELLKIS